MLQITTLVFFPAVMVFSALSDLFTMTISNRVSIALVLVFFPFALLAGLSLPEIGIHLACGTGVLVATFAMFAMGWIGGGDAKLAAATALWVGWDRLLDFGTDSAVIGGALTLAILAFIAPGRAGASARWFGYASCSPGLPPSGRTATGRPGGLPASP